MAVTVRQCLNFRPISDFRTGAFAGESVYSKLLLHIIHDSGRQTLDCECKALQAIRCGSHGCAVLLSCQPIAERIYGFGSAAARLRFGNTMNVGLGTSGGEGSLHCDAGGGLGSNQSNVRALKLRRAGLPQLPAAAGSGPAGRLARFGGLDRVGPVCKLLARGLSWGHDETFGAYTPN